MKITERIPLLRDHHSHPCLYAALGSSLDLSTVNGKEEALTLIRKNFVTKDFVIASGWYDSFFTFTAEEIDPLPPLVVFNVSFHALVMNAAAREHLRPSFPTIVEKHRDRRWMEKNAALVLTFFLAVKPCSQGDLLLFYAGLARKGVWYAEEMSLKGDGETHRFREAALLDRTRFWTSQDAFENMETETKKYIHGIKLFADGAVGARTAKLDVSYSGGEEGILIWRDDELRDHIIRASRTGKALSIHTIGNVAIDRTVTVLAQMPEIRRRFPEIRLEHCQFISQEAASKAKSMEIKLGLQPNFSLDSLCYRDRLPQDYRLRNNPLRMLIDHVGYVPGKDLLFGSDGMPHGARSALESALFPPFEGQKLTLEEFVAGYCMPDCTNGYIEVAIDNTRRAVDVEVILNNRKPGGSFAASADDQAIVEGLRTVPNKNQLSGL